MKVPEFFEAVEEKLGHPPQEARIETELGADAALVAPDDSLAATWFDPSFDPTEVDAIPFTIHFSGSVPSADTIAPPKPSPVYIPADAIAVYAPWHVYRDDFGAYIQEQPLLELASRMADDLGVSFAEIAPHGLRQIVLHEQAHFMFEVAATELEDVAEEWLYPAYVNHAGPAPPLTAGVPEEIWASWREVEYARRVERRFPRLVGYGDLVKSELRQLPPGYRDFELMGRRGGEVRTAVASLIQVRYQALRTDRWGAPTGKEAERMPIYWIGNEDVLLGLGGIPRTVGFPTIRRFEKWLRKIGAQIDKRGGRGSHRKVRLPNGRTAGYAVSGNHLLQPEAGQIARELGIGNARALFEYVRDMKPLP
jgi:hypothetical protein